MFPVALLAALPPIPYVEAKHWNRVVERERVDHIVIHCTDTSEVADRAERSARYFSELIPDTTKASAHFVIDRDSIVQMVPERRIAYGAKGCNQYGLHLEHAGVDEQTREQWLDAASLPMLDLSAMLVGERLAQRWSVPIAYVDAAGLKAGERGITTHRQVQIAFSGGAGHRDPGPGFPMDLYVARAQQYAQRAQAARV